MISVILDFLEDNVLALGLIWFMVMVTCAGVLISEQQNYNLFTSMYHYIPCDMEVTIRIVNPRQVNASQDLIPATCFHTPAHPAELQIGAPPPVNANLWIGICLGVLGCLVSAHVYRNKTSV